MDDYIGKYTTVKSVLEKRNMHHEIGGDGSILETGLSPRWEHPEILGRLICGECGKKGLTKYRRLHLTDGDKIKNTCLICASCYNRWFKKEGGKEKSIQEKLGLHYEEDRNGSVIATGEGDKWNDPEFLKDLKCNACGDIIEKFREVYVNTGVGVKDYIGEHFYVCDECYEDVHKKGVKKEGTLFVVRKYKSIPNIGGITKEVEMEAHSYHYSKNAVKELWRQIDDFDTNTEYGNVKKFVEKGSWVVRVAYDVIAENGKRDSCEFILTEQIPYSINLKDRVIKK